MRKFCNLQAKRFGDGGLKDGETGGIGDRRLRDLVAVDFEPWTVEIVQK